MLLCQSVLRAHSISGLPAHRALDARIRARSMEEDIQHFIPQEALESEQAECPSLTDQPHLGYHHGQNDACMNIVSSIL